MFIGRKEELEILQAQKSLKKSSLVICRGRRRIGKSTLITKFAKNYKTTIQIQGLAPHKGQSKEQQLDNFMEQLCIQCKVPFIKVSTWTDAFNFLASFTKDSEVLIFLDEISWMANGDATFPGKLKIIWDTQLSLNPKLMLVLCGSITSWIDKNILNSTDFMGRISLTLSLKELELKDLKNFFRKKSVSNYEALKILSITGGIPRYLEEIDARLDSHTNILNLCFKKEGILFSEFEKIFNDIFNKRATVYKKIVLCLIQTSLSSAEISKKMDKEQSGVMTEYLNDLIESGLLRRSFTWNLKSKETHTKSSKLSRYSISDNYIRFYLKYINPKKKQINEDLYQNANFELPLKNFDSLVGLQLENLILNNIKNVLSILKISPNSVENFGPYFQTTTTRQQSCQIDLIIQTQRSYYICEIKFKKKIGVEVCKEMQEKIPKLKLDTKKNIKTVLFYAGDVTNLLHSDDYFDFKIEVPKEFWK